MIFKKDNLSLGIIMGLVVPLISLVIYYFVKFYPLYTIGEMFKALRDNKPMLTGITIPCLFLNVAVFTIYINTRRDKTAKGIFASTLLYAIASLLFRFLA